MSFVQSRRVLAALAVAGAVDHPTPAAAQLAGPVSLEPGAEAGEAGSPRRLSPDVEKVPNAGHEALAHLRREHVVDDVYHEAFKLRLGSGPNDAIGLHRITREHASGRPKRSRGGILMLHGDFSSFITNFALGLADGERGRPSLAIWLAQHEYDVWGTDRRWALTPADGDLSDFGGLSFEQEVDDVARALGIARGVRALTGGGFGPLHLLGFSRGGFLAYAAAVADAALPAGARQVRSLIPLDIWAEIPPEDGAARAATCASAAAERDAVSQGLTDSDNSFFIALGQLAPVAPHEPSPLFEGYTNRELFLLTAAQTYAFFSPTETYHLAAAELVDDVPSALSESSEDVIASWFAHAAPHQSMRESADTDGIWCADGNGPPAPDLSRIEVPLFYLGAAGGYGDHGIYSTTRVGSSDVSTLVVRRRPPEQVAADFGHGDLLFATDAPSLAWQPLANWLREH
jgi:hypothetical protein